MVKNLIYTLKDGPQFSAVKQACKEYARGRDLKHHP